MERMLQIDARVLSDLTPDELFTLLHVVDAVAHDERVSKDGMHDRVKCFGRDKFSRIWKSLQDKGYLKCKVSRKDGRFYHNYDLSTKGRRTTVITEETTAETEKPCTENQCNNSENTNRDIENKRLDESVLPSSEELSAIPEPVRTSAFFRWSTVKKMIAGIKNPVKLLRVAKKRFQKAGRRKPIFAPWIYYLKVLNSVVSIWNDTGVTCKAEHKTIETHRPSNRFNNFHQRSDDDPNYINDIESLLLA